MKSIDLTVLKMTFNFSKTAIIILSILLFPIFGLGQDSFESSLVNLNEKIKQLEELQNRFTKDFQLKMESLESRVLELSQITYAHDNAIDGLFNSYPTLSYSFNSLILKKMSAHSSKEVQK